MYTSTNQPEGLINMIRNLITAAALVVATASLATAAPDTEQAPAQKLWEQRHPCKYEDGVNCYWNAGEMGNGGGHSFITRLMPGPKGKRIVCVLYNERDFAKHHDYCS